MDGTHSSPEVDAKETPEEKLQLMMEELQTVRGGTMNDLRKMHDVGSFEGKTDDMRELLNLHREQNEEPAKNKKAGAATGGRGGGGGEGKKQESSSHSGKEKKKGSSHDEL